MDTRCGVPLSGWCPECVLFPLFGSRYHIVVLSHSCYITKVRPILTLKSMALVTLQRACLAITRAYASQAIVQQLIKHHGRVGCG